ncbi:hypothetical protein OC861_002583 [Tilletia horrida]|nr:hypothetical protein OC845_006444 [Tilletia horrida]KAK0567727.1 hypothetical protein OC861_002583 [Tilletia horrida]
MKASISSAAPSRRTSTYMYGSGTNGAANGDAGCVGCCCISSGGLHVLDPLVDEVELGLLLGMEGANDKSSDVEHQEAAKAPTAPVVHQRSGDVGSTLDDAPPAELTRAPGQVSLNEELEFLSPTSAATDPIA